MDENGCQFGHFVHELHFIIPLVLALESSLWELLSLERHYHPAVAALAKACGTEDPSKTPLHNMNDFLVHTYQSLFEQETKRRLGGGVKGTRTRTTPVTFKEPDGVFVNGDVFSGIISWPSKP